LDSEKKMPKIKILVVDDQKVSRDEVVKGLEKIFPESSIDCAGNGEEAISFAKTNNYDLYVTDGRYPNAMGVH
jgi:CheY-like chemotaxis protein